MEREEIFEKLSTRTPIIATEDGLPYTKLSSTFSPSKYTLLRGSRNQTSYIYYQWGADELEYLAYDVDDFCITWGFSLKDLQDYREAFLQAIEDMSPLEKLERIIDPDLDRRFIADYAASLEKDLKERE